MSLTESTYPSSAEPNPNPLSVPKFPALTIISHPMMTRAGDRLLLEGRGEVAVARGDSEFRRPGQPSGAPLEDPYLSRTPFHLTPLPGGGVRLRVDKDGIPVSVGGRPISGEEEFQPEALARGVPLVLRKRIVLLLHLAERDGTAPGGELGMVGNSPGLRLVRAQIRDVAKLDAAVLIRGETGTGKERVAQALHDHSSRQGQFVAVNLATIPETLATAELFGARRGAFADLRVDRKGLFREAQGGTIFLDEIGETLDHVQSILLRALETRKAIPLGDDKAVKLDARVVAATDANIEARIGAGTFRAPLLYRLQAFEIHLPPLRERLEDLGLLFTHFARNELEPLDQVGRLKPQEPNGEPWLPADLALLMLAYPWPGNVRELRNMVQQLIINNRGRASLAVDGKLLEKLNSKPLVDISRPSTSPEASLDKESTPRRGTRRYTREELLEALRACRFEIAATADQLGLVRGTLQNRLRQYGIRTSADLKSDEIIDAYRACDGNLERMVTQLEVSGMALRPLLKTLGLEPDE